MEEQPHESPAEPPAESSDEQPKFFKSMNGMIAGATALVVALGGLFTAYDKLWGDKPTNQQAASSNAAPVEEGQPQATADVPAQPAEDLPMSYEGEFEGKPAKIEYGDEAWVLTDKNGTYTYDDELLSPDDTRLLVFDSANKSYLRWPIKGGMAEWSNDKQTWSNYAKLLPSEPAEDENAAQ